MTPCFLTGKRFLSKDHSPEPPSSSLRGAVGSFRDVGTPGATLLPSPPFTQPPDKEQEVVTPSLDQVDKETALGTLQPGGAVTGVPSQGKKLLCC